MNAKVINYYKENEENTTMVACWKKNEDNTYTLICRSNHRLNTLDLDAQLTWMKGIAHKDAQQHANA